MKDKLKNGSLYLIIVLLCACKQSDPNDVLGRKGDEVHFAGRIWDVKSSNQPVGPGPNYFSPFYDDVWVDDKGYLHLTIDKRNEIWYSSEVISQDTMGYGTYTWVIQTDPITFAENVVLGLFTWDDSTFFTQANSEVDIELSKWGDAASTTPLTYSVQPVSFGAFYPERSREMDIAPSILTGVTTHQFEWTPTLISWKSFKGKGTSGETISEWSFNLNHPPRIKYDGGQASNPIVIPAPGNHTNTRMNLWTLPFQSVGPINDLKHEVVIQDFMYSPL
jgi:hypothetical protein